MTFFSNLLSVVNIIISVVILLLIISIIMFKIFFYFYNDYQKLVPILKGINNNSTYMNFGYWNPDTKDLCKANQNLCEKVISKINFDKKNLLDIGCGYGDQDEYFYSKYNLHITGVDINEKEIEYAQKKQYKKTKKKSLIFEIGDANNLKYNDKTFDNIICIESAFHYSDRNNFFKKCFDILKPGGKLIIADLSFETKSSIGNYLFNYFFKSILKIPDKNFIDEKTYISQLEDVGFNISKESITDKTFSPYFKYFWDNLKTKSTFLNIMSYMVKPLTNNNNMQYNIYECTKAAN